MKLLTQQILKDKISGEISKSEYLASNAWGILTSIDLFECLPETLRDSRAIKKYVEELCNLIEMKRFGECVVVNFGEDPRVSGYSMFQLIETSCISGHFAEDSNSIYLDIFSCKWYDQKKAVAFTKEFFQGKREEVSIVLRGKNIS